MEVSHWHTERVQSDWASGLPAMIFTLVEVPADGRLMQGRRGRAEKTDAARGERPSITAKASRCRVSFSVWQASLRWLSWIWHWLRQRGRGEERSLETRAAGCGTSTMRPTGCPSETSDALSRRRWPLLGRLINGAGVRSVLGQEGWRRGEERCWSMLPETGRSEGNLNSESAAVTARPVHGRSKVTKC